ncbi:MAG TPA: iron-containing alcohol dehydrogenase, partial [Anaerolineaceae bacterium]|nr:iron-containing alcohol dehydrogenase [Anaerolineaceae bacterium]
MTLQFDFATSRRILFGAGKVAETGRIAQGFGQHPLLVRGSGQTDVSPVTAVLKQAGFDWVEAAVSGEPSIDSVRAAAEVARQNGCDLIVACGGGSVLDTGKAVAALLTNPGDLLDYVEVVGKNLPLQNPAAPMIAIPTTA